MRLISYLQSVLLFVCLVLTYVHGLGKTPAQIPNPIENPLACGRPGVPRSQICDPDDMLNKDSKDIIEGYLNAIKKAEIVVVIVSSMSYAFIGVDTIETASQRFAQQLVCRIQSFILRTYI